MIIDKIDNLKMYEQIPIEIAEFLQSLDSNVKTGRYEFEDGNFVNVETYFTKEISEAKFEAHKDYIDIQMLLSGNERIYLKNINGLSEFVPYDVKKDIIFYSDKVNGDYVTLDGSNFIFIYPHEAHAPQCSVEDNMSVKKVVAKIKITK